MHLQDLLPQEAPQLRYLQGRPRCAAVARLSDLLSLPPENVTPSLGKPKNSIDEELQLEDVTYRSWARGSLYDTPRTYNVQYDAGCERNDRQRV